MSRFTSLDCSLIKVRMSLTMELKSWETAVRLEEGTTGLATVEIELEVELFSTGLAWGVVA